MKLTFAKKTIFFLVFISLSFNCSKTDEIPQDLKLNNFVWKGLNAYYLWQSNIIDLQDTRFDNQNQLNNYLSGFSDPEQLFENLLNRPTDRFSIIVDDYIALENSFNGITLNSGMEFGLVEYTNGSNNVFGYVKYVIPDSDAKNKGVKRGMIFNNVDNTPLTKTNYRNLLFGNNTDFTIGLANFNAGNPIANGSTLALTKTLLPENPIFITDVFNEGTKKIGYLMYNQFARNFDRELNAAFSKFKADNVDELIIDLRYNGGGSVNTATYLGAMITGQFNNEIYSKESWNEKVHKSISDEENFINRFTNQIKNTDSNGNVVLNEAIHNLNLTSVYFIVTKSTASASELVINALRPYINVVLIGAKTTGKQVGSITLYDSDNLRKTGSNFNTEHTYAMQPIVLEIVNKDDNNEANGFIPGTTLPGVLLPEDLSNLGELGTKSDPLLNRTINYIINGHKGISKQYSFSNDFREIYSSKLATPLSNNMYVDYKN